MLKAALHQLNSEPVVLLKKLEKCVRNQLPDCKANVQRDAMQRYHIVKKSSGSMDQGSTSLNLKINLTGGMPTCLKRKASLEDAFTEADTVYETPKKLRRDGSAESDVQKKRLKHRQADVEAVEDHKVKISETNDNEKGKLKKKLEKEKLKSTKPKENHETDAFVKPGHRSETLDFDLPSCELQNNFFQKTGKKHEKKKKKSKEKSRETIRFSSQSGSKEQSCSNDIANGNEEPDAFISPHGDNVEESSMQSPKPTSSNETVTDEEVLEDLEDQTTALVQEESNCDVPRSDSAATVALDIEIDRQSIDSSFDNVEPVEYVNLVSPEKTNGPAERNTLTSDGEGDVEFEPERSLDLNPSDKICKRDRSADEKQTEDEARSTPAVIEIGVDNTTPFQIPENDSGCLQINEVARIEVGKPEFNEMDRIEDQSDTLPLESLEKDVTLPSLLEAEQEEKAVSLATGAGSPSLTSVKTGLVVSLPGVRSHFDEKLEGKTLALASKLCCISIDVPDEQLDKRECDIQLEQMQIRAALSEIFAERKSLNKELRLLLSKSQKLEQESSLKNVDISANVLTVKTLSNAVDIAREERNRLAADKKKTHQIVLQTEIKLRELQVQLIRQQLELGDTKSVESNPLIDDITENEKRVADLTEQVASKSSVHKETEVAYQKAEQLFRQKNEEHETLLRNLEEAREMCQKLNDDLSQVTSEIEKIKSKLEVLADEGKRKCLRAVDIEKESIRIESCKKLKQSELKRQQIAAIKDAMAFEEMIPDLYDLLAVGIREGEAESEISTTHSAENCASESVVSPNEEPSAPRPFGQHLPSTTPPVMITKSRSPLLTEKTRTLLSERVAASPELPLHVEMEDDPLPPQTKSICLAIQNTAIGDVSSNRSCTTTTALGSPSVTQPVPPNNLPALRLANSLINPEVVQASTSQTVTTASFAVLPEAISLKSLSEAYPFYSQFLNSNSPTANSDDETILGQEIVNGCRQFTQWKCNHISSTDISSLSRDHPLLRQGAGYMKDYFIPFYRLMLKKNILAVSLFDSIIVQAQKANWYGMSALDSTYMKQMLENNLRCAIEIGTKFKDQACILPSRVEFSPSSGKLSMPTFTIHLATPEAFRSPTSTNQMQSSAKNSTERSIERNQASRVVQGDHSPIDAMSTMITNNVRHHPTPTFSHNSPNGLVTEGHSSMPRQGWTGISEINGLSAYPSTTVQNTALVAPSMNAQYTGRHRMPAVQQTVPPPHSTWSQQQSAHQAYVQTLQSSRMQVPANYQAGPYRQQQATLQHQYTSHSALQQMGQSQQLQQRLLGSGAGDTLSRQNMTILGSHPQGQIPVQPQRMRQHSASQQPSIQQSGSHNIAGIQQVSQSQSHSLTNGHQSLLKQRQIPLSSPPVTAQRLFGGTVSEVSRPSVNRRPSREAPQPQHPVYTCLKCGQEAQQKCSGCQVTFYCSRDCQVAHWEEHGKTCSKQV